MDFEHGSVNTEKTVASVLQGDKLFFDKMISRNSTVGCSSRIFYCRSAEGVPFKWEMQPGTPKDPPKQEIIPPLSPPPALLSLGLRKPCIEIEEPKASMRSRFKDLWKHVKKNQGRKKPQERSVHGSSDKFERFEFYSSDSLCNSSFSSSSSVSFSINGHSRQSFRLESPAKDSIQRPYGCSPWNFSSVLVRVARRA